MISRTRLTSFFQIRAGEERLVLLLVALMLVPAVGGAVGSPGVEALFYARFGVEFLPYMYIALGVVTFITSMIITALLGRLSKRRLYLFLPLVMAGALVLARVLVGQDLTWFYPVLWLGMYLMWTLQALLCWGVASSIFDTRQAKRLFPLFGAGSILGIALGGLMTQPLVSLLGTENLLLVWAVTLAIVFGLVTILAHDIQEPYTPSWHKPPRITEELQQGFRTVKRSTFLRWIAAAVVVFGVLFFSLAFPFSKAVAEQFPDENALAGFLGVFQGITTGVAFLISLLLANRLYARFGFMGTILALPLLYLFGFSTLALVSSFAVLLVFRFIQMSWIQGVTDTASQAVFNIIPAERREQTRAFINGVPAQLGIILVGILLVIGQQSLESRHMFLIGMGAAVLATVVIWQARRAYRGALVDALRAGQSLVFLSEEEPFGGFQRDASAVMAATIGLSDPDPAIRRVSARVLGNLATPELVDELVKALEDEDPDVRAAVLRALAKAGATEAILEVADRLKDPEVEVRLQAVDSLHKLAKYSRGLHSHIRPLLADPDANVRAQAAGVLLALGPDEQAESILGAMARQPETGQRVQALTILAQVDHPNAYDLAAEALQAPQPAVRYAAAQAIQKVDPERCLTPLVQALGDEDSYVREGVAEAIGRIGPPALQPTLAALGSSRLEAGALVALEQLPAEPAANHLQSYAQKKIDLALRYHAFWHSLSTNGWARANGNQDALELLVTSLRGKALLQGNLALQAFGILHDRGALALARENLASADPNQLANALETLDSVADHAVIRPLIVLWEPEESPVTLRDTWLLDLLTDPDPWIRACAVLVAAESQDTALHSKLKAMVDNDPDELIRETIQELARRDAPAPTKGEQPMDTIPTMSIMERILSLRRVSLFANLAPTELKQVASIAGEHYFTDGEVIAHQGETGDVMYIIVSGEVQVLREEEGQTTELARRKAGDYVGEMAIISREPRMASLVAAGDVRILYITQKQFESMLRERPEISLGVMKGLIARLAH